MPGPVMQYPLYACTLTLTTTPANLLTLIRALGGKYANCSGGSASFQLQADPNNAQDIFVGDENVAISPQQCMARLVAAGGADSYAAVIPFNAPIGSVWVVAVASGTALLNVAVFQ